MDIANFSFFWPEIILKKDSLGQSPVRLCDILTRYRGEVERAGRPALSFEHINDNLNPFILRPEQLTFDGPVYCRKWNEEKEAWEDLGQMFFRNEWGICQFQMLWANCKIIFPKEKNIRLFSDIFSQCLGEKCGGALFMGKGELDGERMILKLDESKRLANYFDHQTCLVLNQETDEWKIFGTLIKK